jgi:curved DNA-binding protein CbpA
MNPYEILSIPSNASHHEIKSAYRRLVMQYHPDRNKATDAHERIALINEAYEILSDPQKRMQYDNRLQSIWSHVEVQTEEDPIEAYKREFKRKRRERERVEQENALENKILIYRIARFFSYPMLLFGTYTVFDGLRTYSDGNTPFFSLVALLFTSSLVIYNKHYSEANYSVVYLPFLFFFFTLMMM